MSLKYELSRKNPSAFNPNPYTPDESKDAASSSKPGKVSDIVSSIIKLGKEYDSGGGGKF